MRLMLDDRRARGRSRSPERLRSPRRRTSGAAEGERRESGSAARSAPPARSRRAKSIWSAAARRAREHADAAFSHFKVGAALETADGTVVTGCNVENATYGLTICAERVAMFKALSEGHRAFTRIAIVADTADADAAVRRVPPDSVGVRRQPRGACSPTSPSTKGTHQLKDLLPLPFDARLL